MRWKMPSYKNSKTLYSWLGSFLLILIVPIVLMAAVYWKTIAVMEAEINRANAALLRQLRQDIDGQIESIAGMSHEILLNARVKELLYSAGEIGFEERMTIFRALQDFRVYSSTNPDFDRFYLYFKNGDFILSDSSYHRPETYFRLEPLPPAVSYEEWIGLLNGSHRGQIVNLARSGGREDGANGTLVFLQSLPPENLGNSRATLAVHLRSDRLKQAMDNLRSYHGGQVFILDSNDAILFSSGTVTPDLRPDQWGGMDGEYGVFQLELSGEPITVSYIESELMNWKYVYMLPARQFHEKAQFVRDLTFWMIACALFVGLMLAVLLTRKHYHPLKNLVQSLASSVNVRQESNEYRFLENVLNHALQEKNRLSRTVERQNEMLRSNFLARLVKGRIEQHEPLEESFAIHRIHWLSDRFAVMLFYIEDDSGLFRGAQHDSGKNWKLVHLIIQNVVEELAGRKHRGYVAEADEMLFCLFNVNGDADEKEAYQDLAAVAHEAHQFIQNRFRIELTVSVSNIHRTFRGLPNAYQEAMQAMEYKILNANPAVILYENIRSHHAHNGMYPYTLEKEQQLINYIKTGAAMEAERTVDEIMAGVFGRESPVSVDMVRCLMFDMTSTMMKASMEISSGQEGLYAENLKSIQSLFQCQSIADMRQQLSVFLQTVCRYVEERKNSHNVALRDQVLKLIDEHYRDGNLSLATLAEMCSVNPSYLSRFFKEQVGMTISDYINKYRIEKAKELLVREGTRQKLIAEQVGFCSITTFIRTFKKLEGVTPGMYREGNR